ncbi:class D beta-lactamase [Kordia sp.]|uniref:class D beta-lactamase n=1 Tax=Kordia sp. TaxID=1965332 RepID=UPI003B5CC3A8
MKKLFIISLCVLFFSCIEESKNSSKPQEVSADITLEEHVIVSDFQKIIDTTGVKGSILLYDVKKNTYYSNAFSLANTGKLPASTYKIPNSIIALETNVVKDENEMFIWNGEERFLKSWETDLTFKQAFQRSCVPCYQEVARKIGVARMNLFLEKLQYGTIVVNYSNLDTFWLQGTSKITQFQQINFLKRLQENKLPISTETSEIVKDMMVIKETENYVLRGKTGWSITNNINNGWFVGYLEKGDQVLFFATNVEAASDYNQKDFQKNRKELTYKALAILNILN